MLWRMISPHIRGIVLICLSILSGCAYSVASGGWRTLDEGSFTVEIPNRLEKKPVIFMRSRGAEYSSRELSFGFSESDMDYMRETFRDLHKRFEVEYGSQGEAVKRTKFLLRLGSQYAEVSVETNENWVELQSPGEHRLSFFCPNSNGSALSICVNYGRTNEAAVAWRIIKSVHLK